ncbi:MAG TPA: hypothetical protein VHD35_13130 [Chitinophagaceae bacterium]|nr:hypothetical protein [Chitinophagaceae bacterium]
MTDFEKMPNKRKLYLQMGMSFWIGVGLMSIINIWKITYGNHPIRYSWIMFSSSVFFVLVCLIYLWVIKQKR